MDPCETSRNVCQRVIQISLLSIGMLLVLTYQHGVIAQDATEVFGGAFDDDSTEIDSTGFDDGDESPTTPNDVDGTNIPDESTARGRRPEIENVHELPEATGVPESIVDSSSVAPNSDDQLEFETITERYPDGKTKIKRQVTQDSEENYVNHGPWIEYDQAGNEIMGGTYRLGERDGEWFRYFTPKEAKIFSSAPYNQFNTE